MMDNINGIFWSDSIFCEENTGWYIGSDYTALYKIDFETGYSSLVSNLDNCNILDFRLYSSCIKVGQYIYCFPDLKNDIIIYNLLSGEQERIPIVNPHCQRISSSKPYQKEGKLYVVLSGLGQIVEIDTEKRIVCQYHRIADEALNGTECVLSGDSIVCASRKNAVLYEFNIVTHNVITHHVLGLNIGISTLCYDGQAYWITGNTRQVFRYECNTSSLEVVGELPDDIGVYCSTNKNELYIDKNSSHYEYGLFYSSINTAKRVWLIPFQSNKIVYIDKKSLEIHIFDIPDEEENFESWKRNMNQKYVVEYVFDDNLIGIYSFKNKCIYEINSDILCVERKNYYIKRTDINRLLDENVKVIENEFIDLEEYIKYLDSNQNDRKRDESVLVGKQIYSNSLF